MILLSFYPTSRVLDCAHFYQTKQIMRSKALVRTLFTLTLALMTFIATLILAFGISMDAFAAALSKGAALHRPGFKEALRTGLIFGAIEALTPLIGWAAGLAASCYVMAWDHWVAFFLLSFLGGRIWKTFVRRRRLNRAKRRSVMAL